MRFYRKQFRGQAGFALVVVLWAIGLLALIAVSFAMTGRERVVSGNAHSNLAIAEAAIEGAVEIAKLEISTALIQKRLPRGFGEPFFCRFSDGVDIQIEFEPEAGKVDLNAAPAVLLEALFVGLGANADRAKQFASSIEDYRDIDRSARPGGGEDEAYQTAGLAFGPKNAKFDSVEEIAQVLGMDGDLVSRAQPHLTVLSRRGVVDPALASDTLLQVLTVGGAVSTPVSTDVPPDAARFGDTLTIKATAYLPEAGFVLQQAAELAVRQPGNQLQIGRWIRHPMPGATTPLLIEAAAARSSPC